jgi:hypothetical protein
VSERLPVRLGAGWVRDGRPMTREAAMKHGLKVIDPTLKRVGFVCLVHRSDAVIHGGDWFRINYAYDRRDDT